MNKTTVVENRGNYTVVELTNGVHLCFSYQTCIAFYIEEANMFYCRERISATTTKHRDHFIDGGDYWVLTNVDAFERLLAHALKGGTPILAPGDYSVGMRRTAA